MIWLGGTQFMLTGMLNLCFPRETASLNHGVVRDSRGTV